MAEEDLSDYSLVDRAKQSLGDFGDLYEKYLDKVYRYHLVRFGGNVDLTEEATSETFIRAMKGFNTFEMRHPKSFEIWLYRVASNTRKNLLRARHKRPASSLGAPELSDLPSLSPDPQQLAETSEAATRLTAAINALPLRHREVIHLRYVEDLSLDEIGAVLSKGRLAIKARLHRAMEDLRRFNIGELED